VSQANSGLLRKALAVSREFEMSRDEHSRSADTHLREAEILIWALLDEQLDDASGARLSKMIEEDAAVRARYIDCVQLHVDLREHFGRQATEPGKNAVVLQNVFPGVAGLPGMPQVIE
jgi:anti-sigma factor RsiW